MAIQGQGQLPNNAIDPDLQTAIEFGELVKTLGISFQVRDQNLKLLAGKINSVEELFRSPAFLSRLDQTLYVGDATSTSWIKLTIKKGKIVSFSIISSIKIRCAMLYTQGRSSTDLLYVGYTAGADSKDVSTALPLTDFRPERAPKYFPHIAGETMHDSKELGKFLCFILSGFINNPDAKSTRFLGKAQGFEKDERGKLHFCPTGQIPAELHPYLPPSLLSRQNPCSGNTCNEDMTPILEPLFSGKKWLLIALLFRVASWFQFLYAKRDVYADNILILKPTPAIPIPLLAVLMKNTQYDSLDAPSIGPKITSLKNDIQTINDGVLLAIDTFAADQVKKAEKGYDLLIQDVCGAVGSSSGVHHIPVLISDYADLYIPCDKCCVLDPGDNAISDSPSYIRTPLKRLDANNICRIERGCNGGDLEKVFKSHVNEIQANIPDAIPVSKRNTYVMLVTALRMYREFYSPLFPPDFEQDIEAWLISQGQDRQPLHDLICSEYCEVLNKKIADGYFKFTPKQPVTVVDKGSHTIVVDRAERCIYIETADDQDIATNEMKCINDTDSLTVALYNCDYLPRTSRDEKSVRIVARTSGGQRYTLYVHKMKYDVMDDDSSVLLDLIDKDAFLFRRDELPTENFLPLVKTVDGRYAGKMIVFDNEENNHYFGTGKPGAGKSWAIAQIVCMLWMLGHNVVVFDVSRTYTKEKLYRMLPPEVVDKLFHFVHIGYGQDNILVDLGSLKGCNNLSDKKGLIYRPLAAALGKTDPDKSVAGRKKKALQHFLSDYLRDKNDTVDFVDMLIQMEQDGRVDADIIDTLADVLGEIDEIGFDKVSWGDLFAREKKIIVIDLGNEVGDGSHVLLDILAASLFSWQMLHDSKFLTIAIDELKDQNFAPNSILRSIVSDGRRFHTAILGATQDYFDQRHPQLDAMRQANIQRFCRPAKSEDKIAQKLGYANADDAGFSKFKAGDTIIDLYALNKDTGENEPVVLRGRVVDFADTPFYDCFLQEYGNVTQPPDDDRTV